MTKQNKIAAYIVLAGFVYAAYIFYDIQFEMAPKLESERMAKEQQVTTLQSDHKKLRDFAENIESIKQELRELNLQLETALEHMPRTFNLSGLLRKLTMLAQNSGIELITFKPKKLEEKKEGTFYSTATVELELKGSYTQTLVFLDQLSRLKRIVNLESMTMNVTDGSILRGGATLSGTIAMIRTYRFTE